MTLDQAISKLRELNETVPTPPRLPTAAEVDAAESELGIKFHPDYRRYLLTASDIVFGTKEPATIADPESHTHLITLCEDAWDSGIPKKFIPICQDNGDYYCMMGQGKVVFISAGGDEPEETWPDLATWIDECWIGEES